MNKNVISIESIDSYPSELVSFVLSSMWDFTDLIDNENMLTTRDSIRDGILKYRPNTSEYDFLLNVIKSLEVYDFIAFHVTKQLSKENIQLNGLQVLDYQTHWSRIYDILKKKAL